MVSLNQLFAFVLMMSKKYNIDTLDCKIRHSRTLGGSFHCVTTETLRD
jgi:hypothetical protein